MMRARLFLLPFMLLLALPVLARDPGWPGPGPDMDWSPELQALADSDRAVMPLKDALRIVSARFSGRLIAARLAPPRPEERERGVLVVHELRLLTSNRDVLRLRLDAQTGNFLEVAGPGLTAARVKDSAP